MFVEQFVDGLLNGGGSAVEHAGFSEIVEIVALRQAQADVRRNGWV